MFRNGVVGAYWINYSSCIQHGMFSDIPCIGLDAGKRPEVSSLTIHSGEVLPISDLSLSGLRFRLRLRLVNHDPVGQYSPWIFFWREALDHGLRCRMVC